jgi:hypothetical protein
VEGRLYDGREVLEGHGRVEKESEVKYLHGELEHQLLTHSLTSLTPRGSTHAEGRPSGVAEASRLGHRLGAALRRGYRSD